MYLTRADRRCIKCGHISEKGTIPKYDPSLDQLMLGCSACHYSWGVDTWQQRRESRTANAFFREKSLAKPPVEEKGV